MQVEENLGMSMIFAIVASVIEKMNEYFDENTKNREEAIERAIKLAEEAERVSEEKSYTHVHVCLYRINSLLSFICLLVSTNGKP